MIAELTIDHALHVCRNLDPLGLAERQALIDPWDPVAHAIQMVQTPGVGYSCLNEQGLAVMVGGVHIVRQGLGSTWLAGAVGWREHVIEIAKTSRKVVKALINDGGLHRIQMIAYFTKEVDSKWYKLLGLNYESALPAYGLNGEDFCMYSLVKEIRPCA